MTGPRVFFLSLTADGSQEISPWWLERRRTEIPDVKHAIEVAPGVRAAIVQTGGLLMPDQVVRTGALVAVWSDDG
jgi:hypothetical protein